MDAAAIEQLAGGREDALAAGLAVDAIMASSSLSLDMLLSGQYMGVTVQFHLMWHLR